MHPCRFDLTIVHMVHHRLCGDTCLRNFVMYIKITVKGKLGWKGFAVRYQKNFALTSALSRYRKAIRYITTAAMTSTYASIS